MSVSHGWILEIHHVWRKVAMAIIWLKIVNDVGVAPLDLGSHVWRKVANSGVSQLNAEQEVSQGVRVHCSSWESKALWGLQHEGQTLSATPKRWSASSKPLNCCNICSQGCHGWRAWSTEDSCTFRLPKSGILSYPSSLQQRVMISHSLLCLLTSSCFAARKLSAWNVKCSRLVDAKGKI